MTKIVSVLNLKGGVAKTTLTVALADTFAIQRKRVLVVDLDPQCDTSVMLVGHETWHEDLFKNNKTLYSFFSPPPAGFNLQDYIMPGVSNIKFGNAVIQDISLLASDIRLAEIQDGRYSTAVEGDALSKLLRPRRPLPFDIILIDCPPNFGFFTRSALLASDAYVIPTIADYLSLTLGVERTKHNVAELRRGYSINGRMFPRPKLAGVVITKYQATDRVQQGFVTNQDALNKVAWVDMLHEYKIPQTVDMGTRLMYTTLKITYKNKYPQGLDGLLQGLALALWSKF